MPILWKILEWIGFSAFQKVFIYFRNRYLHSKSSDKILNNKFFCYMKREKNDLLPYWIIEHKGRQALIRCFFPIKVSVFLENMKIVSKKTIKSKKLDFKSDDIFSMVDSYNRKAILEWGKLYPKNKAMEIFTERFSKIHKNNITRTTDRIQYILEKDIKDMEKLDRILDSLYWAFKLSLHSVLDGACSLNGDLTKELGLVIIEK